MSKPPSRIETIADGVTLYLGDCLTVLPQLDADSVDSIVTDPPYHLTSIVKRFSNATLEKEVFAANNPTPANGRLSRGFMGKEWDGGEIAFEPETWAAAYRVLKPGGHLLAFGAPKNFGFMQYAISQAGFEIRDVICWLFGSGFPKSHDVSKHIDKSAGDNDAARKWQGWGTALKPAYEPIIMARKPIVGTVAANVMEHGTGALNIDGCRVPTDESTLRPMGELTSKGLPGGGFGAPERLGNRPIVGIGGSDNGRWPANVIHDGSDEVVEAFPETSSTVSGKPEEPYMPNGMNAVYGSGMGGGYHPGHGDSGSAARFFYSAKADSDDRLGSKHPTVKPVDLMQYLVRLVTPKGGLVLDPFAGSGTTGEACIREGMRAILIEREPEYQDDIRRRMKLAMAGPDERARESIKAKLKGVPPDHGPLFADLWKEPYWNEDGTAPRKRGGR